MATTKEVLDHHGQCFGAGDLAGILSDYLPDSVLFTPKGPLKGPGEMKPLFQAFFAEFAKPGVSFTLEREDVVGDYACIRWHAETADNIYDAACDTFCVRDGKIMAQAFTAKIIAKH